MTRNETTSEQKSSKSYSLRGGARVGDSYWLAGNFTVPFATLTVTRESVSLGIKFPFFVRDYVIPKSHLERISKYKGFFSKGIRIEHKVKDLPPFIVFWSCNWSELAARLPDYGYNLSDKQK